MPQKWNATKGRIKKYKKCHKKINVTKHKVPQKIKISQKMKCHKM